MHRFTWQDMVNTESSCFLWDQTVQRIFEKQAPPAETGGRRQVQGLQSTGQGTPHCSDASRCRMAVSGHREHTCS